MFGKHPVYAFHIFIIEAMYYAMNHTLLPRDNKEYIITVVCYTYIGYSNYYLQKMKF